jgi:hypothetical protein
LIHLLIKISLFKLPKLSLIPFFGFLVSAYIIINGLYLNNAGFQKTSIYLLFAFLPIAAMLIVDYYIENQHLKKNLERFLMLLTLIQLPVLIIQQFTFDIFGTLKLSSANLNEIDFNFGTFFMADDHALGFFLICYLLFYAKRNWGINFFLLVTVITASIFLTNSKTSYFLLFIALIYLLMNRYRWIRIFFLLMIPVILVAGYQLFTQVDFFEQLQLNTAESSYNTGYASRQQILYVLLKQGISWMGNGPYSYFNILTGTFEAGTNFSQWIWNYYDLGLIGVVLFIAYTLFIYFNYENKSRYAFLITMFLIFYGFFTNYTTDFSMMLTYIIFIRL